MKPITDYKNYRVYMLDFFEEQKIESGLSWRSFNAKAGFASPSYLKAVCSGKTKLSDIGARQVALAMNLPKEETEYFCAMVAYSDSTNRSKKAAAYKQMQNIAQKNNVRIVGDEAYDYYKYWWNPILRELAPRMPNALPIKVAEMFYDNVSAKDVMESLDFMTSAGFLDKKGKGIYAQTDKAVRGSSEKIPKAIRAMHRQMAEFGAKAVENFSKEERNFSGLTIAINEPTYKKIVDEINECRKKITEIVSTAENGDRVYRLNLQLFPVTKKSRNEALPKNSVHLLFVVPVICRL